MQYSKDTLSSLLYRLQSIHFDEYKDCTEADVLALLLNDEHIVDYSQIEWKAFWRSLYKDRDYDFPCDSNGPYRIVVGEQLERFINHIVPREERIRVLAFLRENAADTLFEGDECTNICDFRKECARLISHNIEESKRDEYHGEWAEIPRLKLQVIAQGFKPKPLQQTDKIIAQYIPSYPMDIGAFPPEVILPVAHHCVSKFEQLADTFPQTKQDDHKPCMSPKEYVVPIRNLLIKQANRYLYSKTEPIYQVLWTMCLLLRLPHKQCWWRDKFAENIITYLDCTRHFAGTKQQMDDALDAIRAQTGQQSLFPTSPTPSIASHNHAVAQRPTQTQSQFIETIIQAINAARPNATTVNINVGCDLVGEKHVQYEIGNVSPNAIGIQHNQNE